MRQCRTWWVCENKYKQNDKQINKKRWESTFNKFRLARFAFFSYVPSRVAIIGILMLNQVNFFFKAFLKWNFVWCDIIFGLDLAYFRSFFILPFLKWTFHTTQSKRAIIIGFKPFAPGIPYTWTLKKYAYKWILRDFIKFLFEGCMSRCLGFTIIYRKYFISKDFVASECLEAVLKKIAGIALV